MAPALAGRPAWAPWISKAAGRWQWPCFACSFLGVTGQMVIFASAVRRRPQAVACRFARSPRKDQGGDSCRESWPRFGVGIQVIGGFLRKAAVGDSRVHGRTKLVYLREKSELIAIACRLRRRIASRPLGFLSSNRPSKWSKALLDLP